MGFYDAYAKSKNKEQILEAYNPQTFQEYQQVAILVRATDDIISASGKLSSSIDGIKSSIDLNTASADNLSKRIFWLNVILLAITLLGVIFTILTFFENIN